MWALWNKWCAIRPRLLAKTRIRNNDLHLQFKISYFLHTMVYIIFNIVYSPHNVALLLAALVLLPECGCLIFFSPIRFWRHRAGRGPTWWCQHFSFFLLVAQSKTCYGLAKRHPLWSTLINRDGRSVLGMERPIRPSGIDDHFWDWGQRMRNVEKGQIKQGRKWVIVCLLNRP